MDRVQLARLYETGEFADCEFITTANETLKAHRFLLTQYPRLKLLMDQADHNRVSLTESVGVTQRLLQWMYGVDWAFHDIKQSSAGVSKELVEMMSLGDLARKYEMAQLENAVYASLGRSISHISKVQIGLQILRDLTEEQSDTGALQRTIIDRTLSLLPTASSSFTEAARRRERQPSMPKLKIKDDDDDAEIPSTRPERVKKPTAKAIAKANQSSSQRKKVAKTARKTAAQLDCHTTSNASSNIQLHCVCQQPEDPNLVECSACQRWFHPGCIGKSTYAASTYKRRRRESQVGDEKKYREQNIDFRCKNCDEAAAL